MRTGAAVRAAGDPDAQKFVGQPVAGKGLFDIRYQRVFDPFGLGQRQAAGRQGRAGEGPTLDRRPVLGERNTVVAQKGLNRSPVIRRNVAQNDVLVGGQDWIGPVRFEHLAQGGAQLAAVAVDDAAAGDRNTQIPQAVTLGVPSHVIHDLEFAHGTRIRERRPEIVLQRRLDPGDPLVVDQIFESRVPAVGTVTVVAL